MTTDISLKALHQRTGKLLGRVRRGERFRVLRHGETEGFLVPPSEALDPCWAEIMEDVWAAQKHHKPLRANPVLRERKKRKHAARLR